MRQQSADATQTTRNDEIRIAEEILGILPAGVARQCSPDRHTLRYSLRAEGLKLRTIVFNRASLRRLSSDPARAVKIEYLQRDLLESAARRSDYRYPRLHIHLKPSMPKRFSVSLPMVSMA